MLEGPDEGDSILAEGGELIERRVRTDAGRLAEVLGERPRARIVIEASTDSEWVARCLESLGHEVIVADPNFAPMYATRQRKVKTKHTTVGGDADLASEEAVMSKSRTFRGSDGVRPMRRWLVAVIGVILAAGALGLAPARLASAQGDREHEGAELGPGCAPERPAIAHHAGGVIVEDPRGKKHTPPIPCATPTGWRTSEPSIVVTDEGTILFQPTLPEPGLPNGLIRSVDGGVSWDFILHSPSGTPVTFAIDQNLWVDRQTGRVFWISIDLPVPTPPRLDRSDDDGQTWFPSDQPCPNRALGGLSCGHPQVFTGPPPKSLKHLMQGYPNVVYVCVGEASLPILLWRARGR
jgi:hypothetical protein